MCIHKRRENSVKAYEENVEFSTSAESYGSHIDARQILLNVHMKYLSWVARQG